MCVCFGVYIFIKIYTLYTSFCHSKNSVYILAYCTIANSGFITSY
jgi:hypothetical protein